MLSGISVLIGLIALGCANPMMAVLVAAALVVLWKTS